MYWENVWYALKVLLAMLIIALGAPLLGVYIVMTAIAGFDVDETMEGL